MDEEKIINILQAFSDIHGFEYDKAPIPYIPFGGISGATNDGTFSLYISRSESSAHGRFLTNFTLKYKNLIPSGFCIEYEGNPNKKDLDFDDRIVDLSNDKQFDFLTIQAKTDLTNAFNQIDNIDETIFNIRSTLRISESGIALVVSRLFQTIDELNSAYARVLDILINIKMALTKTRERF